MRIVSCQVVAGSPAELEDEGGREIRTRPELLSVLDVPLDGITPGSGHRGS